MLILNNFSSILLLKINLVSNYFELVNNFVKLAYNFVMEFTNNYFFNSYHIKFILRTIIKKAP